MVTAGSRFAALHSVVVVLAETPWNCQPAAEPVSACDATALAFRFTLQLPVKAFDNTIKVRFSWTIDLEATGIK